MQPPARLGIITKPNEPRALELALAIAEWAATHEISLYVNDRVKDLPPSTFSARPEPPIQSDPPLDRRMMRSAAIRFSNGSTAATF